MRHRRFSSANNSKLSQMRNAARNKATERADYKEILDKLLNAMSYQQVLRIEKEYNL